ncbi:hypothetical protein D9M69_616500 [compost metagenome]
MAVLLCWPSLMSPSTITGVSLPFICSESRKRSAVASAVRRMVEIAAPMPVACLP